MLHKVTPMSVGYSDAEPVTWVLWLIKLHVGKCVFDPCRRARDAATSVWMQRACWSVRHPCSSDLRASDFDESVQDYIAFCVTLARRRLLASATSSLLPVHVSHRQCCLLSHFNVFYIRITSVPVRMPCPDSAKLSGTACADVRGTDRLQVKKVWLLQQSRVTHQITLYDTSGTQFLPHIPHLHAFTLAWVSIIVPHEFLYFNAITRSEPHNALKGVSMHAVPASRETQNSTSKDEKSQKQVIMEKWKNTSKKTWTREKKT